MSIPSNFEHRDVAQQWLHNIGTGYKFRKFPFDRNPLVWNTYYVIYKVNTVVSLSTWEQWGLLSTRMFPPSVCVQVDLLLSVVVATVLDLCCYLKYRRR